MTLAYRDFTPALTALVLTLVGFLTYVVYCAIWRLYWSPLAHFPGPRLAALTFWNEFYFDVVLGGKYEWKIAAYHETYGPIVRINPYELHVNDPSFHEKLYVGASKGKTDRWEWSMGAFGVIGTSVFTTTTHDLHRSRRVPWSPYFSKLSIRRIHPTLIQNSVDKLCNKLAEYSRNDKPVVMVHAWATFTADLTSEYTFPQGNKLLDKPQFDEDHYNAWMAFSATTNLSRHMNWLFRAIDALPLWLLKHVSPVFYMSLQERERLMAEVKTIKANLGNNEEQKSLSKPSLLQALAVTPLLPEAEKSPERITSEAQLAMVAGTLTTAHCLKTATYHILANSDVHVRLMTALATPELSSPPTLDELEKIPYLVAIMYESLRLFYGVLHRLDRVFPDRPMYCGSWIIPPGTPVSMSVMGIHDNENIFPDHRAFKPERWLPLETVGQKLLPFLACFGGGSRVCIGQELGKAEILTALAAVWRRFGHRMRLQDTERERDVDIVYDLFNAAPSKKSNGVVVVFEKTLK